MAKKKPRRPSKHKPKPGEISVSIKHSGSGRHTAFYVFPDFEYTECAFGELRAAARHYTELAAKGRHACSDRNPLGLSSCGLLATLDAMRAAIDLDRRRGGRRR